MHVHARTCMYVCMHECACAYMHAHVRTCMLVQVKVHARKETTILSVDSTLKRMKPQFIHTTAPQDCINQAMLQVTAS